MANPPAPGTAVGGDINIVSDTKMAEPVGKMPVPVSSLQGTELEQVKVVLENLPTTKPTKSALAVSLASPLVLIGKTVKDIVADGLPSGHPTWSFFFNIIFFGIGCAAAFALMKAHQEAGGKPDPHHALALKCVNRHIAAQEEAEREKTRQANAQREIEEANRAAVRLALLTKTAGNAHTEGKSLEEGSDR